MTIKIPSTQEWLKDHTESAQKQQERMDDVWRQEQANDIAKEANEVSLQALRTNKYLAVGALILSGLSLIVAIVAIFVN